MAKPSVLDVARTAGVGASTVSRVLNNHPNISNGARARVLAAVEALGYTPDLNARSLRSGQTQAVSVLLPMTGTAFYDTLLGAVHHRLEAHDYDMALFPLLGAQRIRRFRDPSALLYRADALLIASQDPQQLYAGRPPFNKPVVLVDAHHPHYHSVFFDNLAAGRLAAEVALACRLPLVLLDVDDVPGELPSPVFVERRTGILEVLNRQGIAPVRTLYTRASLEGGRAAAQLLLTQPFPVQPRQDDLPTPLFVLALSDEMALGAQRQLGEGGWQMGRDYLLLGFDGNEQAAQAGLSSVAQPVAQMGEAAAEAILAALGGQLGTLIQQSFAPRFVEGASTRRSGT
ncbi:LacI family DNA-binding transcriptional regulator [Deinococcus alpinitundrae]|uniref:LacI family DNA-binding transcriptional regulator n=1 Tax=Deinococcus alpinitundrae TaxID=468913 RepID=UPI00137A3989|nr:LacI family DNA-binding transcriptional regulator [Deinococcus alpinitundrae]